MDAYYGIPDGTIKNIQTYTNSSIGDEYIVLNIGDMTFKTSINKTK